ncbi:MAG: hypothetical protein AB8G15_22660 [Saprospiraceae bacterium]
MKTIIGNQVTSRSNQPLTEEGRDAEFKAMRKNWMKTPQNKLANLFYTYYENNDGSFSAQRATTYFLSSDTLGAINTAYENFSVEEKEQCSLVVYMASHENSLNEMREGTPAFNPIVQLHLYKEGESSYKDSYLTSWRKNSTVSFGNSTFYNPEKDKSTNGIILSDYETTNLSRISPKTAYIFLQEWAELPYEEINNLFGGIVYAQLPKLNSYSFSAEDVQSILSLYKGNPKRELFFHLTVINPSIRTPFKFHIVLEVTEMGKEESRDGFNRESEFYEFGYPCPPYCGDIIEISPPEASPNVRPRR